MSLLGEIRESFAAKQDGARPVKVLPQEYPAWVIRNEDGYGVAVPYYNPDPVAEKFENCFLHSRKFNIDGSNYTRYLVLSSRAEELWYEFATVCVQFVEPGDNGKTRDELVRNPLNWWKKWRDLLGNSISELRAYSVIAEMLALDTLYKKDHTIKWTAIEAGSHDIESSNESFEVKSTIQRYGASAVISGQHQLESRKRLWLYFCRLEKSQLGVSINDVVERLVSDEYDRELLNKQLYQLGFEYGSSIRNVKYKVLENRKYSVDDKFPSITDNSFVDGHVPNAITQIQYTVDLDGLSYTIW